MSEFVIERTSFFNGFVPGEQTDKLPHGHDVMELFGTRGLSSSTNVDSQDQVGVIKPTDMNQGKGAPFFRFHSHRRQSKELSCFDFFGLARMHETTMIGKVSSEVSCKKGMLKMLCFLEIQCGMDCFIFRLLVPMHLFAVI